MRTEGQLQWSRGGEQGGHGPPTLLKGGPGPYNFGLVDVRLLCMESCKPKRLYSANNTTTDTHPAVLRTFRELAPHTFNPTPLNYIIKIPQLYLHFKLAIAELITIRETFVIHHRSRI